MTATAPTSTPATDPAPPAAWDTTVDLVVVGAGVAGLTAALVAAIEGARVLVVEKATQVGGTSARSSGTVWIPGNDPMVAEGFTDEPEAAMTYLDALVGDRAPRELRQSYVDHGPEMLRYVEAHAGVRFRPYPGQPDYRQELPGARTGWRAVEPLPFDGRELGEHFAEVGSPLRELMLFGGWGGMMVTRGEVARLLKLGTSWDALKLGASLVARFVRDRLRHHRGTRLVLGNALVARLYRNTLQRGVDVWLDAPASRLVREDGRVYGIVVRHEGREVAVRSRHGVVLAGGGFPASAELREQYLPAPTAQYTAAAPGSTGDTIRLAQDVGATLGPRGEDNALWFPSSIATRPDGSTMVYPHIVLDRGKPGVIAVNAAGRRFVNEAVSYHEFTRGMYRSHRDTPTIPAWLVCDRAFIWRYGLGAIRPRTPRLAAYERSGYLKSGRSLAGLAARIGVDAAGLEATVRRHNAFAATGVDEDFHRGENAYDRASGDATHGPNPCLGPIIGPTYYAMAVVPTPLGTSLGLLTDGHGQVLDEEHEPIPGLFACGNDMHSPFGGEYPGAGSQLGMGMTFGYLAARRALGR
ncbi:MAG: FAD-dependent oxidoreductase [Dehalococcoidia bacterium]